MAVPRSSGRYRSQSDASQIQDRLLELARQHPRFGYRRLHLYLRKELKVNNKQVQRVHRELGFSVKEARCKHLRHILKPRPALIALNQEWAHDFARDMTAAGQPFCVLGRFDNFIRQSLTLETMSSFSQPECHLRVRTRSVYRPPRTPARGALSIQHQRFSASSRSQLNHASHSWPWKSDHEAVPIICCLDSEGRWVKHPGRFRPYWNRDRLRAVQSPNGEPREIWRAHSKGNCNMGICNVRHSQWIERDRQWNMFTQDLLISRDSFAHLVKA